MNAKKKAERAKPSRSDAPACSPELIALLREVAGCFDAFRMMESFPGLSKGECMVWKTCAEQLQESVASAVPEWDTILKAASDKENT